MNHDLKPWEAVVSINPAMPLAQAQALVQRKREEGVRCPCCGQLAKIYRRKINAGMVRSLISMYRIAHPERTSWVHVPTEIGARSREEGKLAYWGLVEEQRTVRPDGGRAGFWRLTELGTLFVRNQTRVQKYARVYDGHCLGLDGPFVGITEALGEKFDYDELMRS